jgi:hypothetical protein
MLEEICAAAQATGAALFQSDVRTPDVPVTSGVSELVENYFRNDWHKDDLRARGGVPLLLAGAPVVTDQDTVSADEIRRAPYYNEMLPHGFKWFAGVKVWSGSALWALCIQRTVSEGPFEEHDKRVLAPLSRRLTEVATLSAAVGRIACRARRALSMQFVNRQSRSIDLGLCWTSMPAWNPSSMTRFSSEIGACSWLIRRAKLASRN